MSETDGSASIKRSALLFGSIALNIFLIAFFCGRLSMGFEGIPHPPFIINGGGMPGGHMPPPFMHDMTHHAPPSGGDPFAGMPPPPPPFPMMEGLFSQEDMEKDRPFLESQFDQLRELRKAFAIQLGQDKLSPDTTNAYFKNTDQIMMEIKDHFHQKLVDKINAMSPQERKQLAKAFSE